MLHAGKEISFVDWNIIVRWTGRSVRLRSNRQLECRSEEARALKLIIRNEESIDSGDNIGLT